MNGDILYAAVFLALAGLVLGPSIILTRPAVLRRWQRGLVPPSHLAGPCGRGLFARNLGR